MDRLKNPIWEKTRKIVLDRDKVCRRRHISECRGELDVHHIVPAKNGGNDSIFNLAALCRRHHTQLENIHRKIGLTNYMRRMIAENKFFSMGGEKKWKQKLKTT